MKKLIQALENYTPNNSLQGYQGPTPETPANPDRITGASIEDLLNGHFIMKISGNNAGRTKKGISKHAHISKERIEKILDQQDIDKLMNQGYIYRTEKKGRGFTSVEYQRIKI